MDKSLYLMILITIQNNFVFYSSDQHKVHNSTVKYSKTWLFNDTAFPYFIVKKHFAITYSKL